MPFGTLSGSDPEDQFDTIGGLIAHEICAQAWERHALGT